jgi:hypothetical protein
MRGGAGDIGLATTGRLAGKDAAAALLDVDEDSCITGINILISGGIV